MPYYAVANGHTTGIFNTWSECAISVKGFTGAKYKKFENKATESYHAERSKKSYQQKRNKSPATISCCHWSNRYTWRYQGRSTCLPDKVCK